MSNPNSVFPYRLDEFAILQAIEEISEPIPNKDRFYAELVMERLDSCNQQSLHSFEKALNDVLKIDLSRSLSKNDFRNISKVIRHTNKITIKLHKSLLDLLSRLSE